MHAGKHPPGRTPSWADTPQQMATAADGTHPTGMDSCLCSAFCLCCRNKYYTNNYTYKEINRIEKSSLFNFKFLLCFQFSSLIFNYVLPFPKTSVCFVSWNITTAGPRFDSGMSILHLFDAAFSSAEKCFR